MYRDSDQVFYGKVVRIEHLREDRKPPSGPEDFIDILRYTLAVERRFKGKVGPIVRIETPNDSSRWIADKGERRIVFAREGRTWGLCSPIDEAKHAAETMREIARVDRETESSIDGYVLTDTFGPNQRVAPGRTVRFAGSGVVYETLSGPDGEFRLKVPPGRYRIESPGLSEFAPYSRQDASDFDVRPGECAGFTFIAQTPR